MNGIIMNLLMSLNFINLITLKAYEMPDNISSVVEFLALPCRYIQLVYYRKAFWLKAMFYHNAKQENIN